RGRFPQTRGTIAAAGRQALPVRREGNCVDSCVCVSLENNQLMARRHLPQSRCAISTRRRDLLAIGRPDYSPDKICVSAEFAQQAPRRSLPQAQLAIIATRSNALAVRRIGHCPNLLWMWQAESFAVVISQAPEVVPLEAAQIFFTGLRPGLLHQCT